MSRARQTFDWPDLPPTSADIQRETMRGWDDAQVVVATRDPATAEAAKLELESRVRFEASWSGMWSADPVEGADEDEIEEPLMDTHWPAYYTKGRRH